MSEIHLLNDAYKAPRPLCHGKDWVSLSSEEANVTCIDCKEAIRRNKFGGSIVAKLIAGKVTWCGGVARYGRKT